MTDPQTSTLARFDDEMSGAAPVAPRPGILANGFYTLTFPDGSHRTFRVFSKRPDAKFAPGQRLLAMLVGPDNTSDYEGFAFVLETGVKVWKRFHGKKQAHYAALLLDLVSGQEVPGHTVEVSRHCLICNRLLTTPAAIERGIGDTCWGRIHGH